MSRGNLEQRIGVFIDIQNMYYSAKNLYNSKLDFARILKHVSGKRKLIRAIAYVVKAGETGEQGFFDALKMHGFEIKEKEIQVFYGGFKKGDWDVGITIDMIELAPKLDAEVLVSGDGDFCPLIQHLKHAMGCKVEIAAFGHSTSRKLIEEADSFVDLDQDYKRFLLKKRKKDLTGSVDK
ncbi:hypothetical protein COY23_02495 [bacterium (Candidatus Torokbacteria) CG_4_10_14_0_2_um_filter_35_8]|nr:MAG: hypothetical protein COY23_02495 [bacterium (Candidatus Torokbacteria) CG_4_10_14_0_2_um_filter_35_8]